MKVVKLIVCLLFGIMFINSGLNKFFHYMPMPKAVAPNLQAFYEAFMKIVWLSPLVATAEIAGGLLFIFPKTRALGALVIFPVMVGIIVHHFTTDVSHLPLAGVFFLINLWILWDNREKYKPILS
ncbi:MAG: DoxX family membrane protein [Chitinophagaceae bacterium]|jgi:uncharacterized membrane protein YphA (DoxX/SURF4 family)|nr:DoxX family membrane protein [Chitinophagaceae bacterium]